MINNLLSDIKNILFPKNKFQSGVSWNALTFLVMALSGIVLNVLLIIFYGTEILGVFNQVYAVYILASQLAAFGIYTSVLKHISQHWENKKTCNQIISSALLAGILTTSLVSFIYYQAVPFLGKILNSPLVAKALFFSIIGLWCFALNKILLAFLNGLRKMKAFALFTILRYSMMPLSLIALIILRLPGYFSPLVFTITESTLLISLLIFSLPLFSIISIKKSPRWLKTHFVFGAKSLIGGTITELNARIDIFVLGIFTGDKTVGIYSLAAMFAEGIAEIPTIFRVNYNPLLTKLVIARNFKELLLNIRIFFKKWLPFSLITFISAISIYPLVIKIITNEPIILISWIVFIILLMGIMLRSGYAVFWELPAQSGFPGYQTILILLVAGTNTILNFILIPYFGIYGAAIATSLSFVLSIFYLKSVVKKILNIKI